MKIAVASLRSVSPYSQSRPFSTPKKEKESDADREERCWRDRLHVTDDGKVFIPPMSFSNCIKDAAQYLSIKIKGKGMATWTKNFAAGILVLDGLILPLKADQIASERLFLNADGKRGSGTRVWRLMPLIPSWAGDVTFHILDDQITEDIFHTVLFNAGQLVGIGRFRPQNRGTYGRFVVEKLKWNDMAKIAA